MWLFIILITHTQGIISKAITMTSKHIKMPRNPHWLSKKEVNHQNKRRIVYHFAPTFQSSILDDHNGILSYQPPPKYHNLHHHVSVFAIPIGTRKTVQTSPQAPKNPSLLSSTPTIQTPSPPLRLFSGQEQEIIVSQLFSHQGLASQFAATCSWRKLKESGNILEIQKK